MPTGARSPEEIEAYYQLRRKEILLKRKRAARAESTKVDRGPQTDDELWNYLDKTWGVQIPRVKVCQNHVAAFTFFADAFFARSSVIVLKASRGLGGKSYMLAYLGLAQADLLGVDVVILGGSLRQSRNVHRYMRDAWQFPNAPRHQLASDPTQGLILLRNGAQIEPLTASQRSARGPHPVRQIQDECDEMALDIHEAAMGQAMPRRGIPACTVLSSTHQHPDGTFTAIIKKAKEKGWPIMEFCFRETMMPHGWLSPETVTQKQNDLTSAQWLAEVVGQEPSPQNRAILTESVRYMFQREMGEYEGAPREYIEHEPPEPGARYTHGADWGKSRDWSEIVTLRTDVTPARLVAYERMQRHSWPVMVGRYETRIRRYGPHQWSAAHDGTGLGDVIQDYLTVQAEAVILVGRGRSNLFSNYINAIEKGAIVSPYIEALHGQHLYVTNDDLYGAGHPPDGFIAGALAWHARGNSDSGVTF